MLMARRGRWRRRDGRPRYFRLGGVSCRDHFRQLGCARPYGWLPLIGLALAFLVGAFACCFVPASLQASVRSGTIALYRLFIPPQPKSQIKPLYAAPMAAARPNIGSAIVNLLGFLWRWKWALLALVLFVVVGGMLRGCVPFHFGESREHAITRADTAEGNTRVVLRLNERDAVISDVRAHVAAARVTLNHLQEQGHAEIQAVTPPTETPLDSGLVGAWRASIDRLCEFPHADGHFPASCSAGAPS